MLRTDLSGDPSFRELIARVREVSLGAYAHQDVPFEMLVEELQPERNLSHTPLFQVMFALQNAPGAEAGGGESLGVSGAAAQSGTAKFDVVLSVSEGGAGLTCALEYSTDLFDGETIGRMAAQYVRVLEAAAARPEARLSEMPLLSEDEEHQLLVGWNNTRRDYPRDRCLHLLFERQVELTPDSVALISGGEDLTYRELDSRANRLAHHLRSLGVGPEVRVGVCVERSAEMLVGLLGILKAGGAYVPLDPQYPREHLSFMLDDSGVSVLLTQSSLLGGLPPHRAHVLCLDADWALVSRQPDDNPDNLLSPENAAYVIYTSGSTGRPKGVMITHRSASVFIRWSLDTFSREELSAVLASTSICFDLSVFE
ncbi:MAG: AMP-binding protein, partial [Acidobacteria bacterium]|nr:AMP-binding protein [Acidobacteriota bacterium]